MASPSRDPARYWTIVPAAGRGQRMGSDIPKQYLRLHDTPVLVHTLRRLAQLDQLVGMVVVIASDDAHWSALGKLELPVPLHTVTGGAERCHSVLNALNWLQTHAADSDWVLVHDAARPCVRVSDIQKLISAVQDTAAGGLLAFPVRDTMKRATADNRIAQTVDRSGLWHALTPQMFRLGTLRSALQAALQRGIQVTDEAMAIELTGVQPLLVEAGSDNIKITRRDDLELAAFYLQKQLEKLC